MRADEICRRGHSVIGYNCIILPNGYKQCRKCKNMSDRQAQVRRRQRLVTSQDNATAK